MLIYGRLISWHEYLRDQAMYLLAARPNYYLPTNLQKKEKMKSLWIWKYAVKHLSWQRIVN